MAAIARLYLHPELCWRAGGNYLSEYSQRYDCVEVDQWFWSLFGPDKVVLPQAGRVQEYADSVPETFRFAIKMPNALTLSHFYQARKGDALVPNPHFLSPDLLNRFMERLKPMSGRLGPLMFQFGYLNKQMMPARQSFLEKLDFFTRQLPAGSLVSSQVNNPPCSKTKYNITRNAQMYLQTRPTKKCILLPCF